MMIKFLLPHVIHHAKIAGSKILTIYEQDFTSTLKKDRSPLTQADLAAHHYLVNALTQLTPDYPILSEESSLIAWEQRKTWSCYWLIDPLDGTQEFIQRNGEFTVNIALIEHGQPVLGVVYAPALQQLYYASQNNGAFSQTENNPAKQLCIHSSQKHSHNKYTDDICWKIVASRSHPSSKLTAFLEKLKSYELISMGSSLKFCLIASGEAHLYPRLGPTSEWDTAAAHCIVTEAGGVVIDLNSQSLRYNQKNSLINPDFIVAAKEQIPFLRTLLEP